MTWPITIRVKPTKTPSLSRVSLHGIDYAAGLFTPLNLFFKPSPGPQAGPAGLHDFANSLQDVLDRLPFIAGSIYSVQDAQGVTSKQLVDDGRGVDLVWVESSLAYSDSPGPLNITPRQVMGDPTDTDQTLLMVKFTKFTCGTLVMGSSLSHMIADCTSYVDLLKEWARVSRGGPTSDALVITSWERRPGSYFPPPTPGAIPYGMRMPTGTATPPGAPRPTLMSNFFFTWKSLHTLKESCRPSDASAWVSHGDCVGAVLWRALTNARRALLKPGRDVHLYMAVDGRSRSKSQPHASEYFGNLVTPITITLSQSALLGDSLGAVSLAIRRAIQEQVTEANCANLLGLFDLLKSIPRICDTNAGDSRISNWTKYPLVGDALDFGGGSPFWETTERFPAGQIVILPQPGGYLGSIMVESEWAKVLEMNEELLIYAKVC